MMAKLNYVIKWLEIENKQNEIQKLKLNLSKFTKEQYINP